MAKLKIKQDENGKYSVRPYMGINKVTGKVMKPYHRLQSLDPVEAQAEAEAWFETIAGDPLLVSALSLYVDDCEAFGLAKSSVRTYRTNIKRYVAPYLGGMRVSEVTTAVLNDLYKRLLAGGGRDGQPLSPTTVNKVHNFLRGAWKRFVADGIAESNPVIDATKPSPDKPEARSLNKEQMLRVDGWSRSAIAGDDAWISAVGMAVFLGLRCGLRAGEACAVRQMDVSELRGDLLVAGTVIEYRGKPVRQAKTKGKKTRTVSLSDDDCALVSDYLASLRRRGIACGDDGPVVTRDGSWARPSVVAREFSRVAHGELGLPDWVHFHTLRHTHASWMLATGQDLKTVSERVGHASPSTTLTIYAHVLPGRDQEAADAFSALLGGRTNG